MLFCREIEGNLRGSLGKNRTSYRSLEGVGVSGERERGSFVFQREKRGSGLGKMKLTDGVHV
jgi:hypothetical protein